MPTFTSDSLSIENLYRKSNTPEITMVVNEIYKTTVDLVSNAHHCGKSSVEFNPPETFTISGFNKADAQLIVYSGFIERIKRHGLRIELIKSASGKVLFRISWPSVLDPRERNRMQEIIKNHTIVE